MCIWLATSVDLEVSAEVLSLRGGDPNLVGGGQARSVRLGPRRYVHLVTARPSPGAFPVDELLGYDLVLGAAAGGEIGGCGCGAV